MQFTNYFNKIIPSLLQNMGFMGVMFINITIVWVWNSVWDHYKTITTILIWSEWAKLKKDYVPIDLIIRPRADSRCVHWCIKTEVNKEWGRMWNSGRVSERKSEKQMEWERAREREKESESAGRRNVRVLFVQPQLLQIFCDVLGL